MQKKTHLPRQKWVMAHDDVTRHKKRVMSHCTSELSHTYKWVMPHIQMSHVTHTNESYPTYKWVMSHIQMSHVTHITRQNILHVINESCHSYYAPEYLKRHTWVISQEDISRHKLSSTWISRCYQKCPCMYTHIRTQGTLCVHIYRPFSGARHTFVYHNKIYHVINESWLVVCGMHSFVCRMHSTDEGMHSTDEGMHSTDEGMHSTDDRMHSTDDGMLSTDEGGQTPQTKEVGLQK